MNKLYIIILMFCLVNFSFGLGRSCNLFNSGLVCKKTQTDCALKKCYCENDPKKLPWYSPIHTHPADCHWLNFGINQGVDCSKPRC